MAKSNDVVTVRIEVGRVYELETDWYRDEETKGQFLHRLQRGIECGDFHLDDTNVAKVYSEWIKDLEIVEGDGD